MFQVAEGEMVENKLVIPDEMMQYLNQSILGTDTVAPANNPPDPDDKDAKEPEDTNKSSDKISDVATSDDSLLKNLGAIGSDLNISDIPVDLRSLDVSMSGNSGSLLNSKSPDDKTPTLQEQTIPEVNEKAEKVYSKPVTSQPTTNPLQSLQTMAANQTEQSNRMRVSQMHQKNPMSPKTVVMNQNLLSPQSLAHAMLSPQSLPHSAMSPQSVMSPHNPQSVMSPHNIPRSVMSPPSVYNVMSPMSVMSPQHNVMSPQSMQSLMSPQMPNQMMSPRHNNMGSPMSQNMTSPMINMASPMTQNMPSPVTQNISSPMSHGIPSPMHPGLQSPMAPGMTSPMHQNMSNMTLNGPNQSQMILNQNQMMNQGPQLAAPPYMNRQNCNTKMPNRNMQQQNQYSNIPNQNYHQAPPYPQNQQVMRNQNMQQYQMMQYNQSQMPMHMNNQQNIVYNQQMMNYPQGYQQNQMQQLQMSRSSVMSVDNSGNMSRGQINNYCEQNLPPMQVQHHPTMQPQNNMQPQYNQNMQYPQPPPYNSVVNTVNVMGPPPPKNNHQYNQAMMNNNQYYNHQRPYNQWDYPGNQFNKHNQKSVQNSVNMSTGSQSQGQSKPQRPTNCPMKAEPQTDCSMNSMKSQNNPNNPEVQVWDISQSQIEATNGRKKTQNQIQPAQNQNTSTMRQDTYQRTLEYVENCENWKSSEMVSSSTHPLQGGDNMVVNDLQTSLSSFYEENQYLQLIQ